MMPDYELRIFLDVYQAPEPGTEMVLPTGLHAPVVIDAGCRNGRCWWRSRQRPDGEAVSTELEAGHVNPLERLLTFLGAE